MPDFEKLRKEMVRTQLLSRGIAGNRELEVFEEVPRELFMPKELWEFAYDDSALPIKSGQTISQPYMVAIMTELLNLNGNEKVLEIGTGSGYQAAILSKLVKNIYTIERIPELAENAKKIFQKLNYTNIEVIVGDGSLGLPEKAPFDAIIVTAGVPIVPEPLKGQLNRDNGRLVLPVGDAHIQTLTKITRYGDGFVEEKSLPCKFVPLIGKYGW